MAWGTYHPCLFCVEGTAKDGRICEECEGRGQTWRADLSKHVDLVCGHLLSSAMKLARHHCPRCAAEVEVASVDPVVLAAQLRRYADGQDAKALAEELEAVAPWNASPSEIARAAADRDAWVASLREMADGARARARGIEAMATRRAA